MKIERDIPLPAAPAPKDRATRVPVESMEIGDSVHFPGLKRISALGRVKATAMKAGLRHNYKSAVEGDGTRVWRVA